DADCLVDEAAWRAVVSFFGGDGGGTLIAERWGLTAAHTAANIPPAHRFAIGGDDARVARVVTHPGGADLALVELESAAAVGPLSLYHGPGEAGPVALAAGRAGFRH